MRLEDLMTMLKNRPASVPSTSLTEIVQDVTEEHDTATELYEEELCVQSPDITNGAETSPSSETADLNVVQEPNFGDQTSKCLREMKIFFTRAQNPLRESSSISQKTVQGHKNRIRNFLKYVDTNCNRLHSIMTGVLQTDLIAKIFFFFLNQGI